MVPCSVGPWPTQALQVLPAGYVPLAEACWARQSKKRPGAQEVLQRLLHMLEEVEERQPAAQVGQLGGTAVAAL